MSALMQRQHADAGVRQIRTVKFRDVQLRAAADGTGGSNLTFTGYASVYDQPYSMEDWLGPYTEVMRAGAAKRTLGNGADVPFLLNHAGHTLARTKSGTMTLSEDSTGLAVEARLSPKDPVVQSIQSAMDRGDMDEMSMAFWVTEQVWSPDFEQRDILEINLHKGDVSLVNYGANDHTAGASLRSIDEHLASLSEDERRDVFGRLAAEFAPAPVEPVADTLGLYVARARALAIAAA